MRGLSRDTLTTRLAFLVALILPALTAAGCRNAPTRPSPPMPGGDDRFVERAWTDGWRRLRLEVRGRVELTDDERDVKDLSPNGHFELSSHGWLSLGGGPRYVVRRGADGALSRRFTVSGRERPIDAAAREWIGDEIQRLVSRGFNADERVARILAQRGAGGVLDAIPGLPGDFVKAQYYTLLFEQGIPAGPTAQRTLQSVSRNIRSDHERARVLIAFVRAVMVDEAIAPAFVDATTSIASDFEHARVLKTLLTGPGATPAAPRAALLSGRVLRSDFEKGRVLTEIVQSDGVNGSTRDLFFDVVRTMRSDFERGRVLSALARQDGLERDVVVGLVRATAGMGSDFEKARVLLQVIAVQPLEDGTKQALLDTAGQMGSDHERGRVLSALFRRPAATPSAAPDLH